MCKWGARGSPEAEAFLLIKICTFWKKKIVKWQKYHRHKLGSVEGGRPGTVPSKYASAANQELYKNRAVTGNRTMPLHISTDIKCAGYVVANKYVCHTSGVLRDYDNVLHKQTYLFTYLVTYLRNVTYNLTTYILTYLLIFTYLLTYYTILQSALFNPIITH